MGRHDHKREQVAELLQQGLPVTRIAEEADIPLGSLPYLIAVWGLKTIRQQGKHMSAEGSKSISDKLAQRHRNGYMQGENHWSHGKRKLRGEWVPKSEIKKVLEELQEQDPTIAQMAKECGVGPKTITNWLKEFGLQRGLRSGDRCSWWRGGHEKYRGPGWLTIRAQVLDRDEHKCCHCGMTEEESLERGHGMNAHHTVPFAETQDNSLDNFITLCQSCHLQEEWKTGRLYQPG